jgi:glycosidase
LAVNKLLSGRRRQPLFFSISDQYYLFFVKAPPFFGVSLTIKLARMKKLLHLSHVLLCLFLSLSFLLPSTSHAQYPPQYGTPFANVPDPRDVTIYQVNMRAFSSTHNFQGVTNRLDQIKALGVNVIYLMPIYPVGVLKSVNSPYCIRSFDSVGTEFGTLTDLHNLIDGAHSRNMAVILDWVVNQTSFDHPWITQHPDWYLQDGSGNIEALPGFSDVAALNFSSTAMRTAMITAMKSWIFRANVDGFRCDFADNPPIDFWQQTIDTLRAVTTHKLLLLAEGTRSANYGAGFDYNFGFQFYGNLQPIIQGSPVTEIDNSNTVEFTGATGTQAIVRYLTNHDVDGSDGSPVNRLGGIPGSTAAFVVVAYMKGIPFVYNGTEVAFPTAITFPFLSVTIDWTLNPSVTTAYEKIIAFRDSSTAIRRGTLVSYDNNDVCAFTKTAGSQQAAVLVNLRNSTINYSLPSALQNTTWKDAFSGATTTLGTSVALAPYQYIVLTNANVPVVTVTGVSVAPTHATVSAGLTTQLTATVAPANASNQGVSWSSNNTAVATVNTAGLVTAVAAGTAIITVTTADQAKTAKDTITVTAASAFTVNFYRPTSWGTGINIYWWSAQPAGILADGTWPGVPMTNDNNGWYSYTFNNIDSTNLIFNDGSNQTANLARGSNGWYLNGVWYNTEPTIPSGTTYYQILNRWQPNTYLFDGGNGQVKYGANPSGTDQTYQWTQVAAASGFVFLQNRSTGNYMFVENQTGYVQCGTINTTWYSAMWSIADAGSGYSYIQNRWQANQWIHIQDLLGYAEYANAQTGWYSAMWQFVNPTTVSAISPALSSATAATLAADSTAAAAIQLYPNPAPGGRFYLSLPVPGDNDPALIIVHDVNGKVMLVTQRTGSGQVSFPLRAGTYFVTIRAGRITTTRKLTIL